MTRRELPKRPRPPRKSPDTTPYRLSALPCGHVKVSLASGEVGPAGGTLTRPAPAGKSAGHGPPSPRRRGKGRFERATGGRADRTASERNDKDPSPAAAGSGSISGPTRSDHRSDFWTPMESVGSLRSETPAIGDDSGRKENCENALVACAQRGHGLRCRCPRAGVGCLAHAYN
jgi:hypothetical protein